MKCRHCKEDIKHVFVDLGFAPPSNAYTRVIDLNRPEIWYPLRVRVCDKCWLVQTEDYTQANSLFTSDYAYFSSFSSSWLQHAKDYSEQIQKELLLNEKSYVIEIASNDGYLLKNFVAANIPCLGIEPTDSTADVAEQIGVPVLREFFDDVLGQRLAEEGKQADLIIGNNVFAHVPDINSFTHGLKNALKASGTITLEFPHLLSLLKHTQFDTIYHEHFSYFSLHTVCKVFRSKGLRVCKVKKLQTHGGSLRVYGCHDDDMRLNEKNVDDLLLEEVDAGLTILDTYSEFQARVDRIKNNLLEFLIEQKKRGSRVVAYGAAAKGNTLLNYAGVRGDLLPYVIDLNPAKQGKFLPGSHIPIVDESLVKSERPEFVLILPWNIKDEIKNQLKYISEWGGKIVTAIPQLRVES
jgi:hypothetical protein